MKVEELLDAFGNVFTKALTQMKKEYDQSLETVGGYITIVVDPNKKASVDLKIFVEGKEIEGD